MVFDMLPDAGVPSAGVVSVGLVSVLFVRVWEEVRLTSVSVAAGMLTVTVPSAPVTGWIFSVPLVALPIVTEPTVPLAPSVNAPVDTVALAFDVQAPAPLSVSNCVADPDGTQPVPPPPLVPPPLIIWELAGTAIADKRRKALITSFFISRCPLSFSYWQVPAKAWLVVAAVTVIALVLFTTPLFEEIDCPAPRTYGCV